ncbi:heavy metal-binding domain-containing protein [Thiomonas sp.]
MSDSVLVLTTNDCPGQKVIRVLGTVYGTSVKSRTAVGNFLGGIRQSFGGEQSGYTKLVADSRDAAIAALAQRAADVGGNAVLCMRFDSGQFGGGDKNMALNEVTAYGTAVVLG